MSFYYSNIFNTISRQSRGFPILTTNLPNQIESISVQYKSAFLTSVSIFVSYKIYKLFKRLYQSWLAWRLERFYENELDPNKDSEIDQIKNRFIYETLKKYKFKSFSRSFHVMEIGNCGSNFTYIPNDCCFTIVNLLEPLEPFVLKNQLKYGNHLWLYNNSILRSISQVRSNSLDAVVCTYYLNYAQSIPLVINEVYRVLRPVKIIKNIK